MKTCKSKYASSGLNVTIILFLLIMVVFISFYPLLNSDFINWDDDQYVIKNEMIRNLSISKIREIFAFYTFDTDERSPFINGMYMPIVYLSFSLEYHFFKANPKIYHSTNLMLHILNCLVVLLFVFVLTGNRLSSFAVSLFFGIHPMHVESVAWISERKDLLYAFFFILSLLSYLYYVIYHRKIYYIFSLFLFILSLISKPMAVMLPFILLLVDYFKGRKFDRWIIFDKLPFFLLSSVEIIMMTYLPDINKFISFSENSYSLINSLCLASYSVLVYLYRLLLPFKLSGIYDFPKLLTNGLYPAILVLSPLVFVTAVLVVFLVSRLKKMLLFGFLFFVFSIAPVIQLIPIPPGLSPDHYSYISYIGLFLILSELFLWISDISMKNLLVRRFQMFFLIIIIMMMSVLTWQRCVVWGNSISFWNDVIRMNQIPLAFLNRGFIYLDRGDYDLAFYDYNRAIQLKKGYTKAISNRGVIYLIKKDYKNAMDDFSAVLNIEPQNREAYEHRGTVHLDKKDYGKAIADLTKAIIIRNNVSSAYMKRAEAYKETGMLRKAVEDYNNVIKLEPSNTTAFINRAGLYIVLKDYNRAINDTLEALKLEPENTYAYQNRMLAYYEVGDYKKALEDANKLTNMGVKLEKEFIDELIKRNDIHR